MVNSLQFLLITLFARLLQSVKLVVAVFRGRISYYPESVRTFEKKFAESVLSKHAIMFSNATSAIEAALFSVGINSKSTVGTTAFVIPSSYCSAKNLDAELIFYDISLSSLNLNDSLLHIDSDKLSALIVTHFYGNPCNMERIMEWANKNNIFVIEDCSHAHGAAFNGKPLGSWGHIGVFSLQGAKAVAAGEGGVAVTNNPDFALKMAAYGHQESYKKFNIESSYSKKIPPFGYGRKMRIHPLGAELALVDFRFLKYKNKIFELWISELEKISSRSACFHIPKVENGAHRNGFCQGVPLIFDDVHQANNFMDDAKEQRISCFRRDYTDSIMQYASVDEKTLAESLSITTIAFNLVVFIPFYQFIDPRRWSRLSAILDKFCND